MATLRVLERANIFPGDSGNDRSKHLSLQSLKLPALEEKTAQHQPGGGIGEIEIGGLGLNAFSVTFKLLGSDPQTMGLFGIGGRNQVPYTIYGIARDKAGNGAVEIKAIAWGRMTKIDPGEFKAGELNEQDHEIKEIMHYEYYENGSEIYFFDFFSSTWRVNGQDQNADMKSILRIA
ncbi:phage contractile tail tube protein, P2 family [Rhodoblastus acidophilus]|uniref:Phage contractile tail tube protein, P2 family n=1 Tax=Rhodoblastus acidophilus TaxID=1074 RepID=A0A212S7N2_RHOAC|nr:phage major tail tube protein [Rhodoblastus acidophilus]PPQ37068.1 phage tail protein [Rhodoblastus acidophilus]RAI16683.1 phage tail protein [Rhodoblastus acidophilus]SNB81312.1 phage contractile tail tube protein, P2 family [Rhodoblastus acidophilus]